MRINRTPAAARLATAVLLARILCLLGGLGAGPAARADSSAEQLAAYHDRYMAIREGTAYGWTGSERPTPMISGVVQVGVGKDAYYALRRDGSLLTWSASPANATLLMREVVSFAAGNSGWLAINRSRSLWQGSGRQPPRKVAEKAIAAAIGDGSDYYITPAGELHVRGPASRGRDGESVAPGDVVRSAAPVVAVRTHSGRALYLTRDGQVFGNGGTPARPGDKASTWVSLLTGVKGIAAGAAHAAAIRDDGSLWVWGSGFAVEPKKIADQIVAVAAGRGTTVAESADGRLWAWDGGRGPRQIVLDR